MSLKAATASRAQFGLIAIVALVVALPPPAAEGARKPDLVPVAGELRGKPFAFIGERLRVTIRDVTKNRGTKRAGPSLTRVLLRHGGERDRLAARAVGALDPGGRDEDESDARGSNDFKAGEYTVVICVDDKDQVNESNERNNCGRLDRFYSIYREWEGTIGGIGPGYALIPESWRAVPQASFGFDHYLGGGAFSWKVQGGGVTYKTEGASGGCNYSGTGTFALDRSGAGGLFLNYRDDTYTGTAGAPPGATYQVVKDCSGTITSHTAFARFVVFAAPRQELPFGSEALAGAIASGPVNYSWNLAGK